MADSATLGVAPTATGPATVAARLDRLPPNRHTWFLIVLVSFGAFFDIYDLGLSAPLGVALRTAGVFQKGAGGLFGLPEQATFLAATFLGLYAGSLGFSAIADRLGRRLVFTFALLWYAVATAVMGFQDDALSIILWRFLASVGVGLETVAIDCYLAELTPKAIRGKAFAFATSIQFLSAPLVGILAWRLIPGEHLGMAGWRWLTLLPALGAVLIWWVRRALPESPRWLESQGRLAEAEGIVAAIERRVERETGRALPPVEVVETPPAPGARPSLWRPPYLRRTLGLVIFHVFQVIGYFGVSNWLPTLLVAQGITLGKSLAYTAVLAVIPPIAPLVFSSFSDRLERKWGVVIGALLVAAFGLLMGQTSPLTPAPLFIAVGAGVAIGNSLMSLSYHTYQSELFPTAIRARGVGVVYSFSRFSAVFSGYLISATLDEAGSPGVFSLIAASMLIAATAIATLGPRTRARSLEQI